LQPLLLDACLFYLGRYLTTTALFILQVTIVLMYHIFTSSVGKFWVFRVVTLSFLPFSCSYVYSRPLTTILVVCNM